MILKQFTITFKTVKLWLKGAWSQFWSNVIFGFLLVTTLSNVYLMINQILSISLICISKSQNIPCQLNTVFVLYFYCIGKYTYKSSSWSKLFFKLILSLKFKFSLQNLNRKQNHEVKFVNVTKDNELYISLITRRLTLNYLLVNGNVFLKHCEI